MCKDKNKKWIENTKSTIKFEYKQGSHLDIAKKFPSQNPFQWITLSWFLGHVEDGRIACFMKSVKLLLASGGTILIKEQCDDTADPN